MLLANNRFQFVGEESLDSIYLIRRDGGPSYTERAVLGDFDISEMSSKSFTESALRDLSNIDNRKRCMQSPDTIDTLLLDSLMMEV